MQFMGLLLNWPLIYVNLQFTPLNITKMSFNGQMNVKITGL